MSKDIKKATDPVNGDYFYIEGKILQMSFKEIDPDQFGNTHRVGVRIGETWVNNISLKTKEGQEPQLRINAGTRNEPNWTQIEQGDTVLIVVKPNEWKGKTYYNAGVSGIRLKSKGSGGSNSSNGSGGGNRPARSGSKDNTGVVAGNARTAAANWQSRFNGNMDDYLEMFVGLGSKWRDVYAQENTELSEFEVGVTVGQAVLAASQLSEEESFDVFMANYLSVTVPKSLELVKGGAKQSKEKETPKPKTESTASQSLADMDSDIPF